MVHVYCLNSLFNWSLAYNSPDYMEICVKNIKKKGIGRTKKNVLTLKQRSRRNDKIKSRLVIIEPVKQASRVHHGPKKGILSKFSDAIFKS